MTLAAAIGSFALGGISYLISEMANEADQKNDNHKSLFKASVGIVAVSVVFSLNARSKVRKAIVLRD